MSGKRIRPKNITGKEKLADLVDETFLAINGACLKEGCQLFANCIRPFKSSDGRLSAYNASLLAKMIGVRHCILGVYEGKKNWSIKIGA